MTRKGKVAIALVVALLTSTNVFAQDPASYQSEALVEFLTKARISRMRSLSEGVTAPRRATLERNGVTHDAVFKTIEEFIPGVTRLDDGTVVSNMEDNWRFEVAAYRIDRMIGLGLVPVTVEREYRNEDGSMQLWVDAEMSETERRRQGITPPDREGWSQLQLKMLLFDNLLFNWDRHLSNILVTKDFGLLLIDHSRAFLPYDELRRENELTRFSRSLLDGIAKLTREGLRREVGRYLESSKIDTLLKRRDRILELARTAVAERGEAAALYP